MNTKSLLPKLLFAFVLALGFAATWLILTVWAASLFETGNAAYESLVYTPQGEPIIQVGNRQTNPVYRGLDGQRRDFTSEAAWLSPTNLTGVVETSRLTPPAAWMSRIRPLSDGGSPATYWYFMHDGRADGRGYFVGYGSTSKQLVGYLGQRGFRDAPPVSAEDFFAIPFRRSNAYGLQSVLVSNQSQYYGGVYEPWYFSSQSRVMPGWRVYLIDGNRVVQVDLRNRDAPLKTILEADGLSSIALLRGVNWNQASPAASAADGAAQNVQEDLLIASTADEILIYDPVAEKSIALERPADLKSKSLSVYRTINGDFVLQYDEYTPDLDSTTRVYTLSLKGTVKSRIEFQLNPGRKNWSPTMSLGAAAVAPFPLGSTLFASLLQPLTFMEIDKSLSYGSAVAKSASECWRFLAVTYLLGGILAWRCYVRQRRFADAAVIPWVLLVFALGVPGYVGYRLHRSWPIRLLCPSCNRPSPRDSERCVDCGADFPLPEAKGIEVFAA